MYICEDTEEIQFILYKEDIALLESKHQIEHEVKNTGKEKKKNRGRNS